MAASVTTGTASRQMISKFLNTHEEQGRGSCGTQSYTVAQTNGDSCDSFLIVSGSEIVMASTNSGLID